MSANVPSSSGMGASISNGMGAPSGGDGSQQQRRSFATREFHFAFTKDLVELLEHEAPENAEDADSDLSVLIHSLC